jgi:hypothetical protein
MRITCRSANAADALERRKTRFRRCWMTTTSPTVGRVRRDAVGFRWMSLRPHLNRDS